MRRDIIRGNKGLKLGLYFFLFGERSVVEGIVKRWSGEEWNGESNEPKASVQLIKREAPSRCAPEFYYVSFILIIFVFTTLH